MNLKPRGLLGTIIYHLLLLLLLIFAGLTFPDPPPEEEGIMVNFGTDDTGFGQEEPGGIAPETPEPVVEEEEYIEPEVTPPTETYTPPEPVEVDQVQDVEDVAVKEDPKPTEEELRREREEEVRIQREREEAERLEQERLEQERVERERREEQERVERERKAKADRLRNMGEGAFENQGTGTGTGSEGEADGTGNQGAENGGNSDNYGTGDGLGNQGEGYGLDGRGLRSLSRPNVSGCEVTQTITITVDIQVDREGLVVSASVKSATYQDKCIWDTVVEAALKSRFTPEQAAAYRQQGWIRYIIKPK